MDEAPIAVARDAESGSINMQLEQADISKLVNNGWRAPEAFSAKGRDGKTDIWGIIYRPSNFDASKKYPIVEYIYSGPGNQYVPKSFAAYNGWMTSLAELGFIVVQIDGMTTSFRSKEFEEVCYKNLKDAGLPDHIAWIKAAARKYPYMDIDRVGIFGCSAGGKSRQRRFCFTLSSIKLLIRLVAVMIIGWIKYGGMNYGWDIRLMNHTKLALMWTMHIC